MTANTTNGLPYPTGGDALGDLDTIVQALAQELDDQVLAAWEAFTPTWTSSGTAPAVGATGYIRGYKRHRGRTVDFRVKILLGGSGLSAGSGNYNIGLDPVMVSAGNGDLQDVCVGAGVMFDSSAGLTAGRFAGSVFVQSSTLPTVRIALGGTGGGVWNATTPFVPAAGDIFTVAGTYEAPFAP